MLTYQLYRRVLGAPQPLTPELSLRCLNALFFERLAALFVLRDIMLAAAAPAADAPAYAAAAADTLHALLDQVRAFGVSDRACAPRTARSKAKP